MDRQPVIIAIVVAMVVTLTVPVYPGGSEFDGTTSDITIPFQSAISTIQFTIGCWSRHEGVGGGSQGRILNHETGWNLRISDESTDRLRFTAGGWSTTDGVWSVVLPSTNTWYHAAVAYDGTSTANEAAIYLNGVSGSVTNSQEPVGIYVVGTGDLVIGNNVGGTRTWDGQLAECFYYDRVLSANEVKSVALTGPRSVPRGLVGYWPLGVFYTRNYTATSGLTGSATGLTFSSVSGPPLAYSSQGESP